VPHPVVLKIISRDIRFGEGGVGAGFQKVGTLISGLTRRLASESPAAQIALLRCLAALYTVKFDSVHLLILTVYVEEKR